MTSNSSRFTPFAAAALAGALLLTGCGTGSTTTDTDVTLKMGVFFDPTKTPTTLEELAVIAAVDDVNADKFGVTIELVSAGNTGVPPDTDPDTDTDPAPKSETEGTFITPLLDAAVDVIVAPTRLDVTEAMLAEMVKQDIPMMSIGSGSPESYNWVSQGLYFSASPSAWLVGQAIAQQAAIDGGQFLGVIRENDFYSTLVHGGIESELKPLTNQIVVDAPYAEGDRLFFGALDKALGMKPEKLIVLSEEETTDLVEFIMRAGYPSKDIILAELSAQNFYPKLGIEGAKAITTDFTVPEEFALKMQDLVTAAEVDITDGLKPTIQNLSAAARAYDSVQILALAAATTNSVDDDSTLAKQVRFVTGGTEYQPDADRIATAKDGFAKFRNGADIIFDGVAGAYAYGRSGEPTLGKFTVYSYNQDGKMENPEPLNIPNEKFQQLLPEPIQ